MISEDLIELRTIAIQWQIEKEGLPIGQKRRAEILKLLDKGNPMEMAYTAIRQQLLQRNRFILRVRFLLGLE